MGELCTVTLFDCNCMDQFPHVNLQLHGKSSSPIGSL